MNKTRGIITMMLLALICSTACNNGSERPSGISDGQKEAINKYSVNSDIVENIIEVSTKAPITRQDGQRQYLHGAIDFNGNVIVPLKYERLSVMSGNQKDVIIAVINNKYGLVDINGKEVSACQYDRIYDFIGNYAVVRDKGLYGIIDNHGEIVIPIKYENIRDFYLDYHFFDKEDSYHVDDVFYVRENGIDNVINLTRMKTGTSRQGRIDSPYDYQKIERNGKCGFVNYLGEEILCQYENARDTFSQNLVAVVKNNKIGFIDKKGQTVIPFQYEYSEYSFNYLSSIGCAKFSEGLCAMKKRQKFGYIDRQGGVVIPYIYDLACEFHHGKAVVGIEDNGKGKVGLIDKAGNLVVPMEYDDIHYCKVGAYVVEQNNKTGVMNVDGKVIVPIDYDEICYLDNYAYIRKGNKYGVIDRHGHFLLPCVYNNIPLKSHYGNVFVVVDNKKKGLVNANNEVVIPQIFDGLFERKDCSLLIIEKDGKRGVSDWYGNYYLPE